MSWTIPAGGATNVLGLGTGRLTDRCVDRIWIGCGVFLLDGVDAGGGASFGVGGRDWGDVGGRG